MEIAHVGYQRAFFWISWNLFESCPESNCKIVYVAHGVAEL